jgi:lipopolysaccharide/colanic/teichoic acid biosynthesis glycosyltransferase
MGNDMGSIELAGQYNEDQSASAAVGNAPKSRHSGNFSSTQSGLFLNFGHGQPVLPVAAKATATLLKAKRVADFAFSIVALVTLSPLFVVIAILIKATSDGPLLFTQNREGLNGKVFRMYKFRTLHWAASDLSGLNAVKARDPRLTRVGAFLRRTSFDELPQLFNIILGDMSLVGPRPQVPGMLIGNTRYDEVVPYYHLRHTMKPGLTGWAQANGLRGTVETTQSAKARVDHDLAYIANFSLALDLKILIWTIWQEVVQLGRGT